MISVKFGPFLNFGHGLIKDCECVVCKRDFQSIGLSLTYNGKLQIRENR